MRRRLFCGLLLAASLLTFSSCSTITEFVVVNDSGSAVRVSYSFKKRGDRSSCCVSQPAKKALDKLADEDAAWRELRGDEFAYDPATGTLTLTLAPSEVLRVSSEVNFAGHGVRDEYFPVESLHVAGESGAAYYEGRQAQYQFKRESGSLYKLTYYGWGDKAHDGGK